MEDGGWRHPTGNRPQLRVGGGGGGNCREWAGKRTAGDGAHSGDSSTAQVCCCGIILEQRGWLVARAARPPWLQYAALVVAACCRLRGHSLLMLRNAARETMRSGVDHIPASVPFMPLCGRSVLPSMLHLCRSPSLGRTGRCQPTPSFPSFLPSFHPFPVDISPLLLLLPSSEAAKFSSPAARSPLFASFVSLWSGKRLRLQSVPTRRPRGRTGRHFTPNFKRGVQSPFLEVKIPKWNTLTMDWKMTFATPGAMSEAAAACVCE